MSTSQPLCDLISITAEAPYLCILLKKYIYDEAAATPAQHFFFFCAQVRELIISELYKT